MRESQIPLLVDDQDLIPVLQDASDDMLDPLVKYITGKHTEESAGRLTNQLDQLVSWVENFPVRNHHAYDLEIAAELQKFAGNTFMNQLLRFGKGVYYKEAACDVARHLSVVHDKSWDIARIEEAILEKVVERALEHMSDEEKERFFQLSKMHYVPGSTPLVALQTAVLAGGLSVYQMATVVANGMAELVLGQGIPLFINANVMKMLSIVAGPIGWAVSGIWTVVDLAGPAYRVTIPCVIHVAFIRKALDTVFCPNPECSQDYSKSARPRFCGACGTPME